MPGRLIVQDQPHIIASIQLQGLEKMAYDFFTPQPIHGAPSLLLQADHTQLVRRIIPEILKNTVDAMDKDYSTMLINDWVLPEEKVGIQAVYMVRT